MGPLRYSPAALFKSGTPMANFAPDWPSLKDKQTIQVQSIKPERSRTTWFVVADKLAFVPSGYMNTRIGKIWKNGQNILSRTRCQEFVLMDVSTTHDY